MQELADSLDVDGTVLAEVDEAALERLQTVAYLLDESIGVPGTDLRVGLDPLVSAVPVVGDVVSGGLSLYIVLESAYLGVSYATLAWMLGNIAVDVAGGSLPVVGTVFDALWKTNRRNLDLLMSDLEVTDDDTDSEDRPASGVRIDVQSSSR